MLAHKIVNLEDNNIIGDLKLVNASVEFKGKNNILYCQNQITVANVKIRFTGNNSLIFLDSNAEEISLNIRVGNDSVFYLGKNAYINRISNMYATERKNIIIGNEFLLAEGNTFRTADPHLIYDTQTLKRINYSKSILVGDHVWIGQNGLILKGTTIGSGTIIGGHSVLSNKKIKSNTLYAGNPARQIKENIFYASPKSTHNFTLDDEIDSDTFNDYSFVYQKDENTLDFEKIDADLKNLKSAQEKLNYIIKNISSNQNKNRFYYE